MSTPIIPQSQLDHYLTGYNNGERANLSNAFYASRAIMLNGAMPLPLEPQRDLIMTAGSEGTGKSTFLKRLAADSHKAGKPLAQIDSETILDLIPEFRLARHAIQFGEVVDQAEGMAYLRREADRWHRGTKWVADNLVNEAARLSLPIAFETSAHSAGIAHFFDGARAAGYKVSLYYAAAPLRVKFDSANRHHRDDLARLVPEATIEAKSADVLRNLQTYAGKVDKLTLLWRDCVTQPLQPIAHSDGSHISVIGAPARVEAFDAAHDSAGVTARSMLERHVAQARARRLVPA